MVTIKEKMVAAQNQFGPMAARHDEDDQDPITVDSIRLLIPFDYSIELNDHDTIHHCYEDIIMKRYNNSNSNDKNGSDNNNPNNVLFYAIYKVSDNEYESVDVIPIDIFDSEHNNHNSNNDAIPDK
jgi:hypothetical protein